MLLFKLQNRHPLGGWDQKKWGWVSALEQKLEIVIVGVCHAGIAPLGELDDLPEIWLLGWSLQCRWTKIGCRSRFGWIDKLHGCVSRQILGSIYRKIGVKKIASSELRRWWRVQGTLAAIQELECGEQLWMALFSHQKPSGFSHARQSERAGIQEQFWYSAYGCSIGRIIYWLVVWNIFYFSIIKKGCHPSHWLSYVSRWLKPPTSIAFWMLLVMFIYGRRQGCITSALASGPQEKRIGKSSGEIHGNSLFLPPNGCLLGKVP